MKLGDTFTIAGQYQLIPNPTRRWWQVWKPKRVLTDQLQRFKITHVVTR